MDRAQRATECPLLGTGFAYKGHPVADLTHNTVPVVQEKQTSLKHGKGNNSICQQEMDSPTGREELKGCVAAYAVTFVYLLASQGHSTCTRPLPV